LAESDKDANKEGDKPSAGGAKPKDAKDRPLSPTARGQQKRREEKLALIKQQVEEGTLTIRQMTPEERKANPPKPRKKKK
jgi:hypothetical protein